MHVDICTRKCSHQRPDEMWKALLKLLPLRDSVTLDPAAEGWSWREDLQTWSSPANIISMLRTLFPFQLRLQEVKIRITKAFWVQKWLFLTMMFSQPFIRCRVATAGPRYVHCGGVLGCVSGAVL